METQLQSQFFERAETAVGALAAAGLRRWRAKPVDVQALCELPLVQAQLGELGAGSEADVDARRDAVEPAVVAAIKGLPHPYYTTALEHFGLDDTGEKPLGKVAREENAAAVLERSQRWYFEAGRSPDYLGKTPSEYIIALVTVALCGIPDPVAYLAREAASDRLSDPAETEPTLPTPRERVRRRAFSRPTLICFAAVAALALIGVGAWGLAALRGSASAIPPPGSIVDATNGKVYPPQASGRLAVASAASLDTENMVRFCDPAITHPCAFLGVLSEPSTARVDDRLNFRLYLRNPDATPISLLKLRVFWEEARKAIFVELKWLGVATKRTHSFERELAGRPEPMSEKFGFHVTFTGAYGNSLAYIPGTTAIYTAPQEGVGNKIARLPDGIMDTGIAISEVEAPRYVAFSTEAISG